MSAHKVHYIAGCDLFFDPFPSIQESAFIRLLARCRLFFLARSSKFYPLLFFAVIEINRAYSLQYPFHIFLPEHDHRGNDNEILFKLVVICALRR